MCMPMGDSRDNRKAPRHEEMSGKIGAIVSDEGALRDVQSNDLCTKSKVWKV